MIFNCLSPKLAQHGIKSFLFLIFFWGLVPLLLTGCFGGGGGSGSGSGTTVNQLPTANAGTAQTVNEKVLVALDGSASSDPDGAIVSYAWVQTAGTAAVLSNANVAKPTFTAPDVSVDEMLTFELTVTDNKGAVAKSTVNVAVTNIPAPHRGQFVDSPVSGLNWKTATRSGVTDANGYFEYDNPGETITFSIGEQELGTVGTDKTIHVFDLEQSSLEMAKAKGVRLAQLLQTLDSDHNPDNGIQLTPEVKAKFKGASQLNFIASDDTWNTLMNSVSTLVDKPIVSLTVAYEHAAKNLPTSNDCTLPDREYDAKIGGKFSTAGMSCHRKAQLAVLYDYVIPQLKSTVSVFLDDSIIINGENVVNERIQSSLDKNILKNGFRDAFGFLKAFNDLVGTEKARVQLSSGMKMLTSLEKFVGDFVCDGDSCVSDDNGFKAVVALYNMTAELTACTAGQRDSCVSAIKEIVENQDALAPYGYKNISPENAKIISEQLADILGVISDGVKMDSVGSVGVAFGSTLEVFVKTLNDSYNINKKSTAERHTRQLNPLTH